DEFSNFYLEAIGDFTVNGTHYDSFGEFDAGQDSGWMITWNDWFIDQGASEFTVKNGDVIKWQYTCQLGADIGDDYFERDESSGGGAAITGEDRAAAKEVKELIEAIGTVDENSKKAIEAARAAYDKLTDTQKELVPNYDELAAAEKAYAELTGEDIAPAEDTFADVKDHWAAKAIEYVADKGLMKGESETAFAPELATSRAMIATILYRLAGSPAVDGEASYTDIADGAWYADAIRWAEVNNVVSGYADGSFGPNDNITREQLASILYRYAAANGQSMNASADLSRFADADSVGEWARTALEWANAEGLITGKTGNVIDAKGNATRAEVATILMRYLEISAAGA
ncbi:MAG: S-layer homology domain-containing protein, partial [Firmicutes bacterium]|nr:S-layer homology domain-containing protein [Bacillota bacterium]